MTHQSHPRQPHQPAPVTKAPATSTEFKSLLFAQLGLTSSAVSPWYSTQLYRIAAPSDTAESQREFMSYKDFVDARLRDLAAHFQLAEKSVQRLRAKLIPEVMQHGAQHAAALQAIGEDLQAMLNGRSPHDAQRFEQLLVEGMRLAADDDAAEELRAICVRRRE